MRGILESAIRLWPMLAAAGFAAAQGAGLAAGLGASVPEAVVLRLDDPRFAVTERDIADYQVSQRCYPGGLDSRKAAFMRQLEPAVLSRLLFASSGIDISARAMAEEEARVDRETKAPDILACIKSHFGADRERYRRVFLRPILVQKEFYRHLGFDRKVQAKAYADAEAVAKAMADKTFGSLAVRLGLEYSSTTYRAEEASGAAAKGPPSSEGGRAPLPEGAAVFEILSARARVGPALTPRMTSANLLFRGKARESLGLLAVWTNRTREEEGGWSFRADFGDIVAEGFCRPDPAMTAELDYADPAGGELLCRNCGVSGLKLRLRDKSGALLAEFDTPDGAAVETVTRC